MGTVQVEADPVACTEAALRFSRMPEPTTQIHRRKKDGGMVYDCFGRYKPVARKVNPIKTDYPVNVNAPMRYPEFSRDPFTVPFTANPPDFVAGSRLTLERASALNFVEEGDLLPEEKKLLLHVLKLR